jgi:hypothetical protein
MYARVLLSTALLALTLAITCHAGPKTTSPASFLTADEQVCQAIAIFNYNRAIERDLGWSYLDSLENVRRWHNAHNVLPATRQWHEQQTLLVFQTSLTPSRLRQLSELGCLETITPPRQTLLRLAPSTPTVRRRY